jgi:hypothetical protein
MLFKNSVRTSKRTPHFTITAINWLTLFKEIIAVYVTNYTKPIQFIKIPGTYNYHKAFNWLNSVKEQIHFWMEDCCVFVVAGTECLNVATFGTFRLQRVDVSVDCCLTWPAAGVTLSPAKSLLQLPQLALVAGTSWHWRGPCFCLHVFRPTPPCGRSSVVPIRWPCAIHLGTSLKD